MGIFMQNTFYFGTKAKSKKFNIWKLAAVTAKVG